MEVSAANTALAEYEERSAIQSIRCFSDHLPGPPSSTSSRNPSSSDRASRRPAASTRRQVSTYSPESTCCTRSRLVAASIKFSGVGNDSAKAANAVASAVVPVIPTRTHSQLATR